MRITAWLIYDAPNNSKNDLQVLNNWRSDHLFCHRCAVLIAPKTSSQANCQLKIFQFIAPWIASLGPYPTLALFVIPLVLLEPIKPFSAYLIASGHFIFGLLFLALGEVLKITIVERIFHIGRDKLMTINAFALIYNFVSGWLTWVQALPPWLAVKRSFDDFIRWAHKLHGGRARGFPKYSNFRSP